MTVVYFVRILLQKKTTVPVDLTRHISDVFNFNLFEIHSKFFNEIMGFK